VRRRAAKLLTFAPRITGCHVAIESPHHHHRHGRHYRVRVDLVIPGAELVVGNAPDARDSDENAYSAIDRAFDRMARRLEEYGRRNRSLAKAAERTLSEG
jgi:ribosome-associated translation inhibitor RaiA